MMLPVLLVVHSVKAASDSIDALRLCDSNAYAGFLFASWFITQKLNNEI